MPIYTRTGDKGLTSLYGGKRVSKADLRVETYGIVDELTSFIGLVSSKIKKKQDKVFLENIQRDLYKIMSYLSGMNIDLIFLDKRVEDFEKEIDRLDKKLPKLNRFIIPGGNEISAWFHILRVTCRRAERILIKYKNDLLIVKYLNRMSDLFFTQARYYGKGKEMVI